MKYPGLFHLDLCLCLGVDWSVISASKYHSGSKLKILYSIQSTVGFLNFPHDWKLVEKKKLLCGPVRYVWNGFSPTHCLLVSQCQSVLMSSDLRTFCVSNPSVWQGLGDVNQGFRTAVRYQFSLMFEIEKFGVSFGVCVYLFFKNRMWGWSSREQLAPLIKCYTWERIGRSRRPGFRNWRKICLESSLFARWKECSSLVHTYPRVFQREEIEAICAYLFCQLLQSNCIANFRRAVDNLTTHMEREDLCNVILIIM